MPELPEVEIVRRGLEPALAGARITRVEQRRADLRFPFPERFCERLTGADIVSLDRRAKYLLGRLSTGDVLVMHLGMSGRFSVTEASRAAKRGGQIGAYAYDTGSDPKHDHVVLHMSSGAVVTYNDPRRFGFMLLIPAGELTQHPLFSSIGIEPLGNELSPDYLARRAEGRKADLKAFLLDQRNIAGLGNIYVAEALFRAGLSPKKPAACLAARGGRPNERTARLVPAIRSVLEEAIAAGGSTLRDYRQADGSEGAFQERHLVYGREGCPCTAPGCRGTIRRSVQAGRSTFYCPVCQR